MLCKALFVGTGLALALGVCAQAQTAAPSSPAAAPATAAEPAPAPATSADIKAGDVVKDSDGAILGTVVKAGTATNGQMAVVVNVDGKDVSLPGNLFTVADGVVSTLATKAQIEAAIPKG